MYLPLRTASSDEAKTKKVDPVRRHPELLDQDLMGNDKVG